MKKRPVHEYTFNELNILYGGATYHLDGIALFEVYDEGIGSYEYWGSDESQHDYVAVFFEIKSITSMVIVDKLEYGKQTLTEQDINKIKKIAIEDLNDDYDLCSDLALSTREPQE
jgi:hypothetical protein